MRGAWSSWVVLTALTLEMACSTNSSVGGDSGSGGGIASGGTIAASGGTPSGTGGARAGGGTSATGGAASGGTSAGGSGGAGSGAGGAGGSASGTCTRALLQSATESLAAALESADATQMTLRSGATYEEQLAPSDFSEGIWLAPVEIAFQRDFLDVETCETFSEIIVTAGHQYVLGVRLTVTGSEISEVSALVSDDDDWLFSADGYLQYSSEEDWSVIPEDERDTREVLIAAGQAYFDLFSDPETAVPWNEPCRRLEGGAAVTGNTCDVGVPTGIAFANHHWVVDRDLGTSIGIVRFGGPGGLPDSHMFRMLEGKIRYVHTITICPCM